MISAVSLNFSAMASGVDAHMHMSQTDGGQWSRCLISHIMEEDHPHSIQQYDRECHSLPSQPNHSIYLRGIRLTRDGPVFSNRDTAQFISNDIHGIPMFQKDILKCSYISIEVF